MLKKAASVFVQTLKNHGVDRFFCVPGRVISIRYG